MPTSVLCCSHSIKLFCPCRQVLLLDQQRVELPKMPANPDAEERSFLFLLHPPSQLDPAKGSGTPLRVALRSLITCLTANQLILQIIGKVLLQGTHFNIPGLSNVLFDGEAANGNKTGLGVTFINKHF